MHNTYPKPIIIIHWLTLLLVVIAYLSSGNPTNTGLLGQVHVTCGLCILILFFLRLSLIVIYQRNIPQNEIINQYQNRLFNLSST